MKKAFNQLEKCDDATGLQKGGVNTTCGATVATEFYCRESLPMHDGDLPPTLKFHSIF